MTRQREQIDEGTRGGRVRIVTQNAERWQPCTNFCDSRSVTTRALD